MTDQERPLTLDELLELSLEPGLADLDDTAIAVDIAGAAELPVAALARLAGWLRRQAIPVVAINAGDVPPVLNDALDVRVEDAGTLARVLRAVRRNPHASAVLVHVLRAGEQLGIHDALGVESLAYGVLQGGAEFARWLREEGAQFAGRGATLPAEPVILRREGDHLLVVLDSVVNRNALSTPLRDALADAFRLAVMDASITHVHVSANGPVFCAGGDLTEFGSQRDTAMSHHIRMRRMPARYLAECAARTTVHVHGACIGAGIELPAFAGRIEAAPGTLFRLPEVAMGLIPGAGGCVSIPRRIGRQRTALMALLGEAVDAETALTWGLIDAIVI
ncbi:MAG: enoyl-CoA hydratase/isomerase family protein [Pseudomonadales bacterium]|nr:enoyl-CoA hydratase/isomerase family protein [Pseudomonadales bacterium]